MARFLSTVSPYSAKVVKSVAKTLLDNKEAYAHLQMFGCIFKEMVHMDGFMPSLGKAIHVLSEVDPKDPQACEARLHFLDLSAWTRLRKSALFCSFQEASAMAQLGHVRSSVQEPDQQRAVLIQQLLKNSFLAQNNSLQVAATAFGAAPLKAKVAYFMEDCGP